MIIFFDLETTRLGRNAEIIQIGAVHENGQEFKIYIVPEGNIDPEAAKVNGFVKHGNRLFMNGRCIQSAASPNAGLNQLIQWLKNMTTTDGQRVTLVAHNANNFDGPVLINNLLKHRVADLATIKNLIAGIGDSLVAFQRSSCEGPHNLQSLLRKFGLRQHQTHDALNDAKDLKELILHAARRLNDFALDYEAVDRIRLVD